MSEKNSLKSTADLSRSAIARMDELRIPSSPENYTVWYAYYSGSNQELSNQIEMLLKDKADFSEDLNQRIHNRYFGEDMQKAIDGMRETIGNIIDQAGKELGSLDKEMARYESSLHTGEHQLEAESGGPLQQLIVRLLRDTRNAHNSTAATKQSMSNLSLEVDNLRNEVERLSKEASMDPLTGIANRRVFDTSYRDMLSSSTLRGYSFTMLLLDIDHFKNFNDKYGHTIGDMVLRFVAGILDKMTKGQDVAARYGGEEFAILLPDTDLRGGMVVAEKIRQMISKQTLKVGREKRNVGKITISIGVAQCRDDDAGVSLINRADDCLYRAKNEGRNLVLSEKDLGKPLRV